MPVLNTHQIRGIIDYEWSRGSKATEAYHSTNAALSKRCVSYETLRRRFVSFSNGEIDMKGKLFSGHQRTVDDETLLAAVRAYPEATTRELERRIEQAHRTVDRRLHELGYRMVLCDGYLMP